MYRRFGFLVFGKGERSLGKEGNWEGEKEKFGSTVMFVFYKVFRVGFEFFRESLRSRSWDNGFRDFWDSKYT